MIDADDNRRRADLVTAVGAVRARISAACEAVGRDPREVTLIAVTKNCPATDVATLIRIGVADVGESRDQEARRKVEETSALLAASAGAAPVPPVWHFVGRLQSRKCRSVASYATAVHSVDRPKIVAALADAVAELGRPPLDVFVQVSLDDDPERGGVPAGELAQLADAVVDRPQLRLRGLMGVPPIDGDVDEEFARLRRLADDLRVRHPDADALSAGMSGDFDAAIRHGATHVRVGTALLGRRPPLLS